MPVVQEIIVMLGAPGSGKGTQAAELAGRLGLPHIATGDLLRAHEAAATPLGQAAKAAMDRGELVPDDLVTAMLVQHLGEPAAESGAVLDGFPRTVPQAEALQEYLASHGGQVRAVIDLDVPLPVLVVRLAGRWTCPACQASFNLAFNPPRVPGRCDTCGAALVQRIDDSPDVVGNRVQVYMHETAPLIAYYAARGVLRRVDGNRPIDQIAADLLVILPSEGLVAGTSGVMSYGEKITPC